MLIIVNEKIVALKDGCIKDLKKIPDSTTTVMINWTTPPSVISNLSIKPNITTACLRHNLSNDHINSLPPTITAVDINKNTPMNAISALSTKNIETVFLGPGLLPDCVQAIPDSVTNVGISGNTSQEVTHQLASKKNITVASLNNVTDSHIDTLPNSIKILKIDRETIGNVSDTSWENLRNRIPEATFYFNSNVSTQKKERVLGITSQKKGAAKIVMVLLPAEVKENKSPETDKSHLFQPISSTRKRKLGQDLHEQAPAPKYQKLSANLRC